MAVTRAPRLARSLVLWPSPQPMSNPERPTTLGKRDMRTGVTDPLEQCLDGLPCSMVWEFLAIGQIGVGCNNQPRLRRKPDRFLR
jgi:hypothetical protein